ncbi:PAS domain-containing hybrid sensor histidine kinase/response regulator [Desulfogranum mediterraneum]|uniref:PAS domain-containing hybrid sensor histidine kinase/response regulator n=1 Tax=Desulfogranum mediterraneum TaxID=160661 RepID=UPI0004165BBA|nr:PAS domain S-box protein [Desulfogranum mediterraneum]
MFLFFFLAGSLLACFLLYLDLVHSRQDQQQLLDNVRLSIEYSLARALWENDQEELAAIVAQARRVPGVREVLVDENSYPAIRGEGEADPSSLRRSYPLSYLEHTRKISLGVLTISVELESFSSLAGKVGLKMVGVVAGLAVVGAFFLFGLFYFLVGRHLVQVADYSRSLNLSNLDTPLVLDRSAGRRRADELDQVVCALNSMRRTLQQSLAFLQEKEREFEAIVTNSSDDIIRFDSQGRRLYSNPAACRHLGFPREELGGESQEDIGFSQEERELINRAIGEIFTSGSPRRVSYETRGGGGVRYFELLLTPEFSSEGEVNSVIGISRDMTERKEGEAVRRAAFKHMPVLVSITEIETGEFLEVNETFTRLLGYSKEELLNHRSVELGYLDASDRAEMKTMLDRDGYFEDLEIAVHKADGSRLTCLYYGEIIEVNGSRKLLALAQDVSEKRRIEQERTNLERQLHQAMKMEAIGTLAGGIAHDFNNILAAILGFGQIVREKLPAESPLSHDINQILRAGNRAADLVKQILTFSRQGQEELQPMQLQPIVKEVAKLLRSTLPTTIELEVSVDSGCGTVLADATQVHQVLLNLCTNAQQAIGHDYGRITIRLEERSMAEAVYGVDGKLIEPGRYLELAVQDSGPGMSKELQRKIFDPFFTTKGPVQGTGLGLSVTLGIVTKHNGAIVVNSESGSGTVMKIYLPVTETCFQPVQEEGLEPYGGDEHILLVDDEPLLVEILERSLGGIGYQVTSFLSSQEALHFFQSNPDTIDLVVTDMTMPVMTGAALAREILALRPEMKIILCTGYSDSLNQAKAESIGISALVDKPVVGWELAKIIRESLADG